MEDLATLKINHYLLNPLSGFKAAEACGRESCRTTLPLFLSLHSKVKALMHKGLLDKNGENTKLLRDEIRGISNSLIEMACSKMDPVRFVGVKIALLQNEWGEDEQRDWDLVRKKELEEARQITRSLVLDWCDARKRGMEISQEIGSEADEHLREAFSFRALEASVEYYSQWVQCQMTPEEILLSAIVEVVIPRESKALDKVLYEILQAVLVVFGPQKAMIVCKDLFKISK